MPPNAKQTKKKDYFEPTFDQSPGDLSTKYHYLKEQNFLLKNEKNIIFFPERVATNFRKKIWRSHKNKNFTFLS